MSGAAKRTRAHKFGNAGRENDHEDVQNFVESVIRRDVCMQVLYSLPPAADATARLLLLGSMPGAQSLAAGQYYAHPRNDFWRLMFHVLSRPDPRSYEARIAALIESGVALWDVIYACEREGSLDKNIRAAVPNDIPGFLITHPAVKTISFNGTMAQKTYFQNFKKQDGIAYVLLPSSSPVPRRYIRTFEDKLTTWREIERYL